jgi:hypothetical protein
MLGRQTAATPTVHATNQNAASGAGRCGKPEWVFAAVPASSMTEWVLFELNGAYQFQRSQQLQRPLAPALVLFLFPTPLTHLIVFN